MTDTYRNYLLDLGRYVRNAGPDIGTFGIDAISGASEQQRALQSLLSKTCV
jgi:hypothetical protein